MFLYREHHIIIEFFCYFFKINERLTYKFNKREYTFETKYYMKQIKKKHHILIKATLALCSQKECKTTSAE